MMAFSDRIKHLLLQAPVAVTIDKEKITSFPVNETWILVEQTGQSSINVLLPRYSVLISYQYPSFSVSLPSHIYKNKVEGLCGNCDRDPTDDDTSNLGDRWLVKSATKCVENEVKCFAEVDPIRCNIIDNKDVFGKCHALVDPAGYMSLCQAHLCHNGSVCESVEAYAKACRDVGVCIDWRSDNFCPYNCSQGMYLG